VFCKKCTSQTIVIASIDELHADVGVSPLNLAAELFLLAQGIELTAPLIDDALVMGLSQRPMLTLELKSWLLTIYQISGELVDPVWLTLLIYVPQGITSPGTALHIRGITSAKEMPTYAQLGEVWKSFQGLVIHYMNEA